MKKYRFFFLKNSNNLCFYRGSLIVAHACGFL